MNNYSFEHIQFLKMKKKEKLFISLFRLLIIFFVLLTWEVLSKLNIINTFLYSSPSRIINTLYKLTLNGLLIKHIFITLFEVFISFIISTVLGIMIASLLWSNSFIQKILDPYITIINSLPKVALGPLIILWCGAGIKSIIFMSLLISLFITIINIYQAFISTDINYLTMIKSFGASKWQCFKYVVFPANMSNIISTLKINISMNLIGVIMGELLVSKTGLGYLIMYGSQIFNINLVITCIFILGFISYLMYCVVNKIK